MSVNIRNCFCLNMNVFPGEKKIAIYISAFLLVSLFHRLRHIIEWILIHLSSHQFKEMHIMILYMLSGFWCGFFLGGGRFCFGFGGVLFTFRVYLSGFGVENREHINFYVYILILVFFQIVKK